MDTKEIEKILGSFFNFVTLDGTLALEELKLSKNAKILDVGTGEGLFAVFLTQKGYMVLTGEPSSDSSHYAGKDWAQNAKKMGVLDQIRFEAFDASNMPFQDEEFDAVFFFVILHHVDEGVRNKVCSESLRVLKKKGTVVFFEPQQHALENIWVEDPNHPLAVKPSMYLTGNKIQEKVIEGSMMKIHIFKNPD